MIEVNLLPRHLRKKKKAKSAVTIPSIPKEAVVGLFGGLAVVLFIMHFLLTFALVFKFSQKSKVEEQIKKISPEWEKVKIILKEIRTLQAKINAIEEVTVEKRISWSQKLNEISDRIPKGVWLNKLSLDRNILLVDGTAASKEADEMITAGAFTSSLKNSKSFMRGLKDIEVSSIQRRQIKSVQVADFLITVKLRN